MNHLKVLEGAGLVVTRRNGREKPHLLNPVPIRLIHDRWKRVPPCGHIRCRGLLTES